MNQPAARTRRAPGQDVIRCQILDSGTHAGGHSITLVVQTARLLLDRGFDPIPELDECVLTEHDSLRATVDRILHECWHDSGAG